MFPRDLNTFQRDTDRQNSFQRDTQESTAQTATRNLACVSLPTDRNVKRRDAGMEAVRGPTVCHATHTHHTHDTHLHTGHRQ